MLGNIRLIRRESLAFTLLASILLYLAALVVVALPASLSITYTNIESMSQRTIAVYPVKGLTPLTAIAPVNVLDRLKDVPGVEEAWGETIAPGSVNQIPLSIRGVTRESLARLGIGECAPLDVNEAVIPVELARQLGLREGDNFTFNSYFTLNPFPLHVKCVVSGLPNPYKNEILVNETLALSARGRPGFSIIFIKVGDRIDMERLEEALHGCCMPSYRSELVKGFSLLKALEASGKGVPVSMVDYFSSRLGVPVEVVYTILSITVVLLLAGYALLYAELIAGSTDAWRFMIVAGLSPSRMKMAAALVSGIISILSWSIAYLTVMLTPPRFQILSYELSSPPPAALAVLTLLVGLAVSTASAYIAAGKEAVRL